MVTEDARPQAGADTSAALSKSPLALVLAQVQFRAELTALAGSRTTEVDTALRSVGFPAAQTVTDTTIQLTPSGPIQMAQGSRRVYQDVTGGLQVAVTPRFIALFASRVNGRIAYEGHEVFLSKLSTLVEAIAPIVEGMPVARIGFRYVDQFVGDDLARIDDLLTPACRGITLADAPSKAKLLASVLRAQFSYGDEGSSAAELLQMQSGLIPAGQSVDPSVSPINGLSWALDIDASSQSDLETTPFTGKDVAAVARRLQARARDFFDTVAVTNEFERRFR